MHITLPDDFHLHIRQGEPLAKYLEQTSSQFGRALLMPNTIPPVNSAQRLEAYKSEVIMAKHPEHSHFTPLFTFKITSDQRAEEVDSLKHAGAIAGKLYPQGATTNSEDGVADVMGLFDCFAAMEERELVLCIHGEDPDSFVLDREKDFLPKIQRILDNFPKLRIVLEHVSTKEAVDFVKNGPDRLAATVTLHHLMSNLNDMLGNYLQPHLFCKPVLKAPEHQKAINDVVFSQNPRFFYGTDSAPHSKENKECDCGCAGVYTAPVALSALAYHLEKHDVLNCMESFTSQFGADFYQLERNKGQIELIKAPFKVGNEYDGVVPFMAGEEIPWTVGSIA